MTAEKETQQGIENLESKAHASDLAAEASSEREYESDADIVSGVIAMADQEEYVDEP